MSVGAASWATRMGRVGMRRIVGWCLVGGVLLGAMACRVRVLDRGSAVEGRGVDEASSGVAGEPWTADLPQVLSRMDAGGAQPSTSEVAPTTHEARVVVLFARGGLDDAQALSGSLAEQVAQRLAQGDPSALALLEDWGLGLPETAPPDWASTSLGDVAYTVRGTNALQRTLQAAGIPASSPAKGHQAPEVVMGLNVPQVPVVVVAAQRPLASTATQAPTWTAAVVAFGPADMARRVAHMQGAAGIVAQLVSRDTDAGTQLALAYSNLEQSAAGDEGEPLQARLASRRTPAGTAELFFQNGEFAVFAGSEWAVGFAGVDDPRHRDTVELSAAPPSAPEPSRDELKTHEPGVKQEPGAAGEPQHDEKSSEDAPVRPSRPAAGSAVPAPTRTAPASPPRRQLPVAATTDAPARSTPAGALSSPSPAVRSTDGTGAPTPVPSSSSTGTSTAPSVSNSKSTAAAPVVAPTQPRVTVP